MEEEHVPRAQSSSRTETERVRVPRPVDNGDAVAWFAYINHKIQCMAERESVSNDDDHAMKVVLQAQVNEIMN